MKVKGKRVDAYTGETRDIELAFKVDVRANGKAFYLLGGPTGYESFYLKGAEQEAVLIEKGWWACAGTKGRWDGLFIPGEQMKKVFDHLRQEGLI